MAGRAQTVTLLFTDLVSSTELLQRAGDERAQRILKAHHRLLSDAVQSHGGHEVKWLGDGLMVAFDSARDAALCAVAMQQASRRPAAGERLDIRVGLHVGEALRDESDYFGTSVVIARRLCDSCADGEIRVSDLVVRLLDGRDEFSFDDLGEMALKGIAKPVRTWQLRYRHDPLAMLAVTPFVGRDGAIKALLAKLDEARAGKGALAMLVGEPGIGKTRTAMEFCETARQAGARVLWGRCYDGEWAPPFSPFMEVIREYASITPPDELRSFLGSDAGVLARIVPMLHERITDISAPPAIPPEGERYRLLEAVGDFLTRLAAEKPLVLVLDDLHWADKGTVAMLRQVARLAPQEPLLIIGAYRDIELNRTHPLADALQTLRRETNYERIVLKGLDAADVSALLTLVAEQDVPHAFAKAISDETGGNPFFIREVVLHLVEEGKITQQDGRWTAATALSEMRIPEGVREVIGRRLSRVSEPCGRMLTVASALTAGFTWDVIAALVDLEEPVLLDAIDEALGAQLIVERERAGYDFTHALIRHTLYEELSTPRRVRLHRHIGEALERLYADDVDSHVAELAHHFGEAADVMRGVRYSRRAALRAIEVAAYDEAQALLDRALALNQDERERCELLLLLGRIQFYRGMQLSSLDPFVEAASIARRLGDPHLLGRAAINEGRIWPHNDERFGPLLRESLTELGDEESALRAQVMILHATRTGLDLGREGVLQAADDAAALARRCGNDREVALVLMHRWLIRQAVGQLEPSLDRVEAAREMLEAAERSSDHELRRAGRIVRYWSLMEHGDVVEAEEHIVAHAALTDASKIPADMHVTAACRASVATMQGRFSDAERLTYEAESFDERGVTQARPTFVLQLVLLRILEGRIPEAQALLASSNDPITAGGGVLMAHATNDNLHILVAAWGEDRVAARSAFEAGRPPTEPRERLSYALHRAAVAPDSIALLDDATAAERFYQRLLPWAHRPLTLGLYSNLGSASRQLGLLATTMREHHIAQRHFNDAIAMNNRMGARPWVARTQLDYARMLRRRDAAGDSARARELLDSALATAREIGMAKVAADCESLLAEP